jgi:Ca2+/Na+ antiporter
MLSLIAGNILSSLICGGSPEFAHRAHSGTVRLKYPVKKTAKQSLMLALPFMIYLIILVLNFCYAAYILFSAKKYQRKKASSMGNIKFDKIAK